MLYTEKELQDTLKKDVTISKETEKRMQETYAQIRRDTKTSKKRGRKHTSMAAAAALAVILISGTTAGAAYISAHTDLLGNVFGQQSRTTKEAYDTVVDNGKGGTTVTMPSREYVAVDEAQAEKLVEPYVEDLNITRKIGDYSVKYSMYIGHKDIALGENPNADKDERYMCCFVETNAIFERYSGVLVSDDFAEIAKVFGQRVADAAEEIIQENERACQEVGMNEELTTNSCKPISYEDSIENKVVVVKGSILRPEFRHANHQLMLCTGGFGAQANARGRTCCCISLYDGRKTSFYRTDFLGVMEEKKLPEWAQKGLEKAKEMHAQEKKPTKERGDAR